MFSWHEGNCPKTTTLLPVWLHNKPKLPVLAGTFVSIGSCDQAHTTEETGPAWQAHHVATREPFKLPFTGPQAFNELCVLDVGMHPTPSMITSFVISL